MKTRNHLRAWIILGVYLTATCILFLLGYSVQKPAVERQEFPFTITYFYQGETDAISDAYVAEYVRDAKYIGDQSVLWFGYIKDHDKLSYDYYRVVDFEDRVFSININLEAGYLMGDPAYAGSVCRPTAQYNSFDGVEETVITDPFQLEELGFSIVSWEYPEPIENTFSFGGISLSSESTVYSTAIAVATLLMSMLLIRKDQGRTYSMLDKLSIFINWLIAVFALPFILVTSALSEIVADASFWQQVLYLAPSLTALSIAASLTLRRLGYKTVSFWIQFTGPAIFALSILLETL